MAESRQGLDIEDDRIEQAGQRPDSGRDEPEPGSIKRVSLHVDLVTLGIALLYFRLLDPCT